MLHIEPLKKIIVYCLISGKIKNEKPLSLIIAANPESGKSEVVKKFKEINGVVYLTDCTAHGITKEILPRIETGGIHHIMIPDLLNPLSRKQSTVQTFITFMNALIEEGVAEISTYATGMTMRKTELRCGLITAITKDKLSDKRHEWARMGFLSRAIPFSYSYSQQQVREIMEYIVNEKYHSETKEKLKIPANTKDIKLAKPLARMLMPEAYKFADANTTYGFRMQKQLQTLMKSIALYNGRKKCTKSDFNEVMFLLQWINLKFNTMPSKG